MNTVKERRKTRCRFTRQRKAQVSFPYDVELAVMEIVSRKTGHVWSLSEIGEMCGITRQAAAVIEHNALRKLRLGLSKEIEELQTLFPFA